MIPDRSDNGTCERCGAPVNLSAWPPQPCGECRCPDCPGCTCPTCEEAYQVKTCTEEGCDRQLLARGWCQLHYSRWLRGAEVAGPPRNKPRYNGVDAPPIITTESGCWEWQGWIDGNGYGGITLAGKQRRAHRWMYEREVGPIPDGLQLDHLCRNRPCVNPAHLEPVTSRENSARGEAPNWVSHRENRCKRNHEFTPENTYVTSRGTRSCRTCHALHERARRARRRGVVA